MLKLVDIKRLHNFEPIYSFSELPHAFARKFDLIKLRDSKLYRSVKTLANKAFPSEESEYETKWLNFYVPSKRKGYFIVVPMGVTLYDKNFYLSLPNAEVEVSKGAERNALYLGLIEQCQKFLRILKKDPGIVERALPYDLRTGRVLGKYVRKDLLPVGEKEEILKQYRDHVKKRKRLIGVSLDDYLDTAAICYRASFGTNAEGLTAEEMYRKWADGRDGGLLEIKDRKSRKDFGLWLYNNSHRGCHPFEIVFSWHDHGIHLYPPSREKPYFILMLTDDAYARYFFAMVKALLRKGIPFSAESIEHVLGYLSGETYFVVNTSGEHSINSLLCDRNILPHIKWDSPKMVKWH